MDASSAVSPTVRETGKDLFLAYYVPNCRDSAVVAFRDVSAWSYGPPNDEGLGSHPLWGKGLDFYHFHSLGVDANGDTTWLATFHDGLFQVRTKTSEILCDRVAGHTPWAALDEVVGPGVWDVLD